MTRAKDEFAQAAEALWQMLVYGMGDKSDEWFNKRIEEQLRIFYNKGRFDYLEEIGE